MRAPTKPSRAGSRVSEAIIISSTPMAEAMARPVTNARPISEQAEQGDDHRHAGEDHRAAAGVDGLGDRVLDLGPGVEASRYLVTMNRA